MAFDAIELRLGGFRRLRRFRNRIRVLVLRRRREDARLRSETDLALLVRDLETMVAEQRVIAKCEWLRFLERHRDRPGRIERRCARIKAVDHFRELTPDSDDRMNLHSGRGL